MDDLKKISSEMAELLRAKNAGGFAGQVVTRDGVMLASASSEQAVIATGTSSMPTTTNVPTSGITSVTSPSTSYVVKEVPRTGGHW